MKRKFIICVLTAIAMVFTAIPAAAFGADTGVLWVNGKNILSVENHTIACGTGTAVYDEATGTLILQDADITQMNSASRAIDIPGGMKLTIKLIGENHINVASMGVFSASDETVTFAGSGSLDVTTDAVNAIIAKGVTVDGVSVKINTANDGAMISDGDIIIKNGAKVNSAGTYFGLLAEGELLITGGSAVTAKATEADCNAVFVKGSITIEKASSFEGTSSFPALFSKSGTEITDSTVNAVSADESAIASRADITIDGKSVVTATGFYAGISATKALTVNDGMVKGISTDDIGIWVGDAITINGGEVYAKGGNGEAAMAVRYVKQPSDTDPVAKITLNSNYQEISGGKISVSDWDGADRSWTSFIAKEDSKKLAADRSNALKEVTIKMKASSGDNVIEQPSLRKPGVPSLKAAAASASSVKVFWKKVEGAKGYQVYRASSKNGKYKKIKTTSASSWINTRLRLGKSYYYKVRAYDRQNGKTIYGSFSKKVKAGPKLSTPSFKLNPGNDRIKVSWKKVRSADGYKIYRSKKKNGTYKMIRNLKNKGRSYTSIRLTDHRTYYYKMRAYKIVNGKTVYSSYSKVRSARTK